jgi:hypothetical protein
MGIDLLPSNLRETMKVIPSADITQRNPGCCVLPPVVGNGLEGMLQQSLQFMPLEISYLFARPPLALFQKNSMPNITSSRHSIVEREKRSLKDLAIQAHSKNLNRTLIVPPTTGTATIKITWVEHQPHVVPFFNFGLPLPGFRSQSVTRVRQ